jgi:hypothetical protein
MIGEIETASISFLQGEERVRTRKGESATKSRMFSLAKTYAAKRN